MTATHAAGPATSCSHPAIVPACTDLFPGVIDLEEAAGFSFGRVVSEPVPALEPARLREAAASAYRGILAFTEERGVGLVRIWNQIPHIDARAGGGLDMYMVFGEGRYRGFAASLGSGFDPSRHVPASTGIGATNDRLTVDFIAAGGEIIHVRNSRQIDAYRYSPLYGPKPPCFARATLAGGGGRGFLFLAGTASILGERTVHREDLGRQITQTLDNLRWLVSERNLAPQGIGRGFALEEIQDLVVYHARPEDREAIERRLGEVFPSRTRRFLLRRDLCRRDMLVEIEGVVRP